MFIDVIPYKWLMYEKYDTTKNKDTMYIEEILEYFTIFDGTELNFINFKEKWSSFFVNANQDIIYNILL